MSIKGIQFYFVLASLWLIGICSQASASTPFYFIAKPWQSASNTPNSQVYLRWDTLESNLPDDVDRIELLRDGDVLLNISVNQVMTEAQIQALYQRSGQRQNLLQTLTNLQDLAIAENTSLSPNNFASALRTRIVNDSAYAYLASRQDFNVALARYRAFIDTATGNEHEYEYELVAISSTSARARLGLIKVNVSQSYQVLAAADFKQVTSSQCDSPSHFRYNYSVALDWNSAGKTNPVDALTSDIAVAGYDLYRTKDNLLASVQTPPARNIATLAQTSPYNAQGQWILPGLEKVNRLPLMINSGPTGEPEWLETQDQLMASGLKPGDRRAYYLVPKDFTGQYGPTSAAIVVVPNLVRPQMPWGVDLYVDETKINNAGDQLTLSWDAVNYANYVESQLGQKQICNAQEAKQTGFIEYVNQGQSCKTDTRRSVRVDVDKYLVYRFDNFESASQFKDSDGDGAADLAERADKLQCNRSKQPVNATSYLLNPAESASQVETVTVGNTIRKKISIAASDNDKGKVYWYRLASITVDGRLSLLSAPIRALLPDRTLPGKPTVEMTYPADKVCGCTSQAAGIEDRNAIITDSALNYSGSFTLSCAGKDYNLTSKDFLKTGLICNKIAKSCLPGDAKSLTLDGSIYSGVSGSYPLKCNVDFPNGFDLCGIQELQLKPEICQGSLPAPPNDVLAGPVTVTAKAPEGSCVSIYRSIGGEAARIGTSCGSADASSVDVAIDQGLFCGYAVSQDKNNNISQSQVIPCVLVQNTAQLTPSAPQPVGLVFDSDSATVTWRNPLEPVAVNLIEMAYTTSTGLELISGMSVPAAGLGSGSIESFDLRIPNLTESQGRLCIRLKSLSPNALGMQSAASPWSAQLCKEVFVQGQVKPNYLPWPLANTIAKGSDFKAHIGFEYITQGRTLGVDKKFVDIFEFDYPQTDCTSELFRQKDGKTSFYVFPVVECTLKGKNLFTSQLGEYASFMLYRQSGDASNPGEWVQVSPLIDYTHWDYVGIKPMPKSGDKRRFYKLNDPYIKLYYYRPEDNANIVKWRAALLDSYPYDMTKKHRYQIVYFDDTHRIVHWRLSEWIDPAAIVSSIGGQNND